MARILFVCLGNICRSPMAEGLFRQYADTRNSTIEVDSAATSRWEVGNPPHPGTQKILKKAGVDFSQMFSRQLESNDFYYFDYIVGMDKENIADILAIAPKDRTAKVASFMSIVPGKEDLFIPDPYYTGDFNETEKLVRMGLAPWFEMMTKG
ncbi:protein-tyrosine-phosphatase [Enterococcus saigonensis]|uniref:protein-tyrosine-phosphatase n=1 Tax=Enterococcus saigonensis TaxID=1805431 RepID=A0A679IAE5_9ENTE|nr:low molecular weight protein-tyrosine-phosphatase [Enterococcus saigonensis]BCA86608.1 protein-tyrosine-phosphatase [Enterococcus saigonensis]